MRVLVDTHALFWWQWDDPKLSEAAREAIATAEIAFVSMASVWEAAINASLGPQRQAFVFLTDIDRTLDGETFTRLAIETSHAQRVSRLAFPKNHRDPFDRMLIAQAQVENLAIVSKDTAFDAYGVERVW